MPKKSDNELKVIPLNHAANALRPPANMPGPERAIFAELIAANPPNHFRSSDMPLLVSYCSAVVLHECAVAELRAAPVLGNKSSPWLNVFEKTGHAMVALAMRLRLSPQARAPNPTKKLKVPHPSAYEKMTLQQLDDDDDDGAEPT
jgi:phage terminase small subunit